MKLVIVGVSKFSQMLKDYITDLDVDVLAYTVDGSIFQHKNFTLFSIRQPFYFKFRSYDYAITKTNYTKSIGK